MTRFAIIPALAGAILVFAPEVTRADHITHPVVVHPVVQTVTITVSCYRGPWEEVVWDRPNPVFVDSLVAAGYSFAEAHAIAQRVCRDPSSVGRPEVARAVMQRIIVEDPPN